MSKNIDELLIEKRKKDKYQKALNDVISNAGTKFDCKPDSFYLLQELVNKNLASEIVDETYPYIKLGKYERVE